MTRIRLKERAYVWYMDSVLTSMYYTLIFVCFHHLLLFLFFIFCRFFILLFFVKCFQCIYCVYKVFSRIFFPLGSLSTIGLCWPWDLPSTWHSLFYYSRMYRTILQHRRNVWKTTIKKQKENGEKKSLNTGKKRLIDIFLSWETDFPRIVTVTFSSLCVCLYRECSRNVADSEWMHRGAFCAETFREWYFFTESI